MTTTEKQELHFVEFDGEFYLDSPAFGLIDTYPSAMLELLEPAGGATLDLDYGGRITLSSTGVEIGPPPMTRQRFRLSEDNPPKSPIKWTKAKIVPTRTGVEAHPET